MTGTAFDALAAQYDAIWTETSIGRCQREAVWRSIDPLFQPGHRILDVGCGTGADAAHLMDRGIDVCGIDASAAMVRIARARGVNALCLAAEELQQISGPFDGVLSNFGVL